MTMKINYNDWYHSLTVERLKFRNTEISPVGIGTAAWGTGINGGDQMYGSKISENTLTYMFRSAIAQDINLFDTSPAFGTSEETLGYASRFNKNVLFSTKFLPGIFQRRSALRKSAENSLAALGTDSLDFFGLQAPTDIDKWTAEVIPLLDDGTVKNVGVSNFNISEVKKAQFILEKSGHSLSYVQKHHSIASHTEKDDEILEWCKKNDALFMAYMVLEQGALTYKYSNSSMFDSRTIRSDIYNRPVMESLKPLKSAIHKMAESYSVSDAQIAIAWSLGRGTLPIIGITKSSHIGGIVSATGLIMDEDDIEILNNTSKSVKVDIKGFWEPER